MGASTVSGPRFNGALLKADAEDKGFTTAQKLAAKAGKSDQTILRFYAGTVQTATTLNACCRVLKTKPRRYRLPAAPAVAATPIESHHAAR